MCVCVCVCVCVFYAVELLEKDYPDAHWTSNLKRWIAFGDGLVYILLYCIDFLSVILFPFIVNVWVLISLFWHAMNYRLENACFTILCNHTHGKYHCLPICATALMSFSPFFFFKIMFCFRHVWMINMTGFTLKSLWIQDVQLSSQWDCAYWQRWTAEIGLLSLGLYVEKYVCC